MSRHQPHRSRNERSRPLHHSHRDFQYGKKKVTTKNLAATLGMMGLAVGATLLVEGGPWKSRMAAAATVVGMEQVLERTGFFDGKEGKGVERAGREEEEEEEEGRRERRDREERGARDARDPDGARIRRDVNESDDDDGERRYRDRRERERERESRRDARGATRDSYERARRDTREEERGHRERRARRKEANRRFDEKYEIEEIPA